MHDLRLGSLSLESNEVRRKLLCLMRLMLDRLQRRKYLTMLPLFICLFEMHPLGFVSPKSKPLHRFLLFDTFLYGGQFGFCRELLCDVRRLIILHCFIKVRGCIRLRLRFLPCLKVYMLT